MSENVPPAVPVPAPAAAASAPASAPAVEDATAKLTPAQLKAQKKAEKAARRGQVVAAKNVPEAAPPPLTSNDSSKGVPKQNKSKQDHPATPTTPKAFKKTGPTPAAAPAQPPKPKGPELPEMFSYLSIAKKHPLSKADKDVHPAVLAIGQQMASFTLKDNLARVEAMLVAFKIVSSWVSSLFQHRILT